MRFILACFLFLSVLFGAQSSIGVDYNVKFGIIGKVGKAEGTLNKENDTYHVKIFATTIGMAKAISGGRQEIMESKGIIKEGVYIPQEYLNIRETVKKKKKDVVRYTFDHEKKEIKKSKTRFKEGSESTQEQINPFYAQDDLISIFLNHMDEIVASKPKERLKFKAIGAGHDGDIEMFHPEGKDLERLKRDLRVGDDDVGVPIIVTINQKIFGSEKGELFLFLEPNGIVKKALLKDVALFGDFFAEVESVRE